MSVPPRTPPRFVPTLTAVVDLDAPPVVGPELVWPETPAPAPRADAPAATVPPAAEAMPVAQASAEPAPTASMVAIRPEDVFEIEEELLHRVLQRVDLRLEEALTDVVSQAVQQQLDAMSPVLRNRLEDQLRQLISNALAEELSAAQPRVSAGVRAPSLG
jgi:hypothetical protein